MEQYIRTCPVCGIEFNARIGRSKQSRTYCSLICSNKSRARPLIPCPICGKPFEDKVTKEGRKRFCSRQCAGRNLSLQVKPKVELSHADEYIRNHYATGNIQEIMDYLGLGYKTVTTLAKRNGVKRDKSVQYKPVVVSMTNNNPMHNPESLAKVAQYRKDNPDAQARVMAALNEGKARIQRDKPSKPELKCANILTELGAEFEHQPVIKAKFIVDFRIGNIILQVDGEYWHGHPRFEPLTDRQIAQRKRDAAQDKYLTTCGYRVIRVWERDVTPDNIRRILNQ